MRRYITSILLVLTMMASVPCQFTMAVGENFPGATNSSTVNFDEQLAAFWNSISNKESEKLSKVNEYFYKNFGQCNELDPHGDSWLWKLLIGWTKGYGANLREAFSLFNWQQTLCNVISVLAIGALLYKN